MVSVYWREKAGARFIKRDGQTSGEYWLRYQNEAGKQKWQRVGAWHDVPKAKLLRERALQRAVVAKQWGLEAPSTETAQSVTGAVERFIVRKKNAGKRPATIYAYELALGYFKAWCPKPYIEQITADDLLAFAAWRKKRGDAPYSVYAHFLVLMTFMKFCGRPRLLPKSEWPSFVERLVEAYTAAETELFRQHAADERERLLVEILIHTGFRHGEVSHLMVGDIDWAGNKLSVTPKPQWDWQPKTHECRKVRVPGKLMLMLRSRCADKTGLLFATSVGTPDCRLDKIVKEIAKRAGITGRVDVHKFRSSFATRMSGRFRPQDVQQMLGHKSLLTTMRYLAATDQDDPEYGAKVEGAS